MVGYNTIDLFTKVFQQCCQLMGRTLRIYPFFFYLSLSRIVSPGLFQELNYKSIRVDSPLVMVVNGRKLGADKQALTSLALVAKSE